MDKKAEFLMLVQTGILTKYASSANDGNQPLAKAAWAMEHMHDAIRVANSLSAEVDSFEAARAFVRWAFNDDRVPGDEAILGVLFRE